MTRLTVGTSDSISPKVSLVEQLVHRHERRIRLFIGRRSGPEVLKRATIDDIFQETMAEAVSSAESFVFRDDHRFVAWITTIARRVIARCVAGQHWGPGTIRIKRAESSGIGVPESELGSGGRTPLSLAAGRERYTALRAAVGTLPEHYRRVLTLYKLEELPLAVVAERMDRTKGATCKLIARAVEQLRRSLVDHERSRSD